MIPGCSIQIDYQRHVFLRATDGGRRRRGVLRFRTLIETIHWQEFSQQGKVVKAARVHFRQRARFTFKVTVPLEFPLWLPPGKDGYTQLDARCHAGNSGLARMSNSESI